MGSRKRCGSGDFSYCYTDFPLCDNDSPRNIPDQKRAIRACQHKGLAVTSSAGQRTHSNGLGPIRDVSVVDVAIQWTDLTPWRIRMPIFYGHSQVRLSAINLQRSYLSTQQLQLNKCSFRGDGSIASNTS